MLSEKDFANIEKQANQLYADLELEIIEEIATRIANFGYANTVVLNDVKIAQEMGMLYQDIVELVAKYNNTSYEEVNRIFTEAAGTSLSYDDEIYKEAGLNPTPLTQSESIKQTMNATIQRTAGNLQNLVLTTAAATQTQFYNAMNKSYMEVSTGVKSYTQSILDAINDISSQGAYIIYPSGRRMSLESAVRMNIVTSVNQNCGKLQELRADEMGWDLMELTAHSGARPSHASWQGKIVSRSGKKGYLSLDDIGHGEVTGFKGVNCRHDWYPYYKGSARAYSQKQLTAWRNEKVEYNGKKISKYEATQIQRKMERQIRNDKKDISGLQALLTTNNKDLDIQEVNNSLNAIQVKMKQHNSNLNDFLTETGLEKDYNRLFVGKEYNQNVLKKNSSNGIIIRDKSNSKSRYEVSPNELNNIINNELSNINFPITPTYNSRIRDNGKTIATLYPWGEVKEIKNIYIGKQDKETKEFLIDTLLHEKLEAKILLTKTSKYQNLNNLSEEKRHEYINNIIKRYFRMKGWNYGNT